MSTTENDSDSVELSEDECSTFVTVPEALLGSYSVRSPGVQIVLDGRAVSAPPTEPLA
jgi:hypothetical protein